MSEEKPTPESGSSEHLFFDHDEIVADMRYREPEEGWTKETCQHRAYRLVNHRVKRGYWCCFCHKRFSREEKWKPPIMRSESPFVELEEK